MTLPNVPPSPQDDPDGSPEGARPAGRGYWFTPLPTYLMDAVYDPDSPVNAPAAMLWAHIHRHYAWRERIFPSFATLAEETGQGERTVRRLMQALKDAGALTWGATFSSKGRSSNEYALAPVKPFDFDRGPSPAVAAKSGRHSQVTAKSGHHPPVKSDRHPPAKNGRGVKSSSYLESTGESLSRPAAVEQPTAVAEAPEEREIPTSPDTITTQPAAAPEPKPDDDASSVAVAWREARGGARVRRTEAAIAGQAAQLLADGHQVEHLRRVAAWMAGRGYTDLERAVTHREAPQAAGTAPVAHPAAAGHRPFQCPPADVYDLGFDGRPLSVPPPWCGDPDCSEVDRMRDVELPDGLRAVTPCRECHPEAVTVTPSLLPAPAGAVTGRAGFGPLPGTDTKVAGWLALPTG